MKSAATTELVEDKIDETLAYYDYPRSHWLRLNTNNPMERLLREVNHVSATRWGTRIYMNMKLLEDCARHEELEVA